MELPSERRAPLSTIEGIRDDITSLRRARASRRLFLALLACVVLAGLAGMLGIRTREVSASGGGYTLTVRYAAVARPGLAAPLEIHVTHRGGFDGPIRLQTSTDYLRIFDENGLAPDPAEATATPDAVVWEFDPPPGDTLLVRFDGRIEPGAQWGREGSTAVLENGRAAVVVSYRTWVMP